MRVGIASDHGGFVLKEQVAKLLRDAAYEVVDFGALHSSPGDDYPDYVIPLARAVAAGTVDRGIALCGSGVGASICANKVAGVRAGLIHDVFSAHQGVEDDDMNVFRWRTGHRVSAGLGIDPNISQGSLQRRRAPPTQSRQSEGT